MTSYFKYTSGEAFTLNNADYIGFFHIVDGIPYTDKSDSLEMLQLTPKSTFMSKFYLKLGSFNTIYKGIQGLYPYYSNVFDLFNKQGLDTALEFIDDGNLTAFKGNILGNPIVYRFEENGGFFYGLSGTNDLMNGKTNRYFTTSFEEPWTFLDEIKTATFTVDTYDNFKYFVSNGTALYVLSGNFVNPTPLTVITSTDYHPYYPPIVNTDYVYGLYNDLEAQQMFFVKTDTIDIYDTSNFDDCGNLIIVDQIQLNITSTREYVWNLADVKWGKTPAKWKTKFTIDNTNNPQFIKFGNNVRTSISNNILYILNKHSSEIYNQISLSDYNMTEVLSLDVRNTDDNILLMYRQSDIIKVLFIDSENGVLDDLELKSIQILDGYTTEYEPTIINIPNYTIKFSDIDSDMFYVYNKFEYQTRFISNPTYPSGRLELNDLFYPKNYKWGEANIKYNLFTARWSYGNDKSNFYNNLVSTELSKNDKMYMLHQNVGRLYAMHQPPNDRFYNSIPLNLVANFNGTICSESTFGLYFNNSISNIVKDTVNIFIKSYGRFEIGEREVAVQKLNDLVQLTNDLYLNGNETFNVLSLQRIFLLINDLQSSLIPISVEN